MSPTYALRCTACAGGKGYTWASPRPAPATCPFCGHYGTVQIVSRSLPPNPGGKPRKFKYTYQDIADAKGVTIYAVRAAVKRGLLEPGDLKSVCSYMSVTAGGYRGIKTGDEEDETQEET